jgi:hypothetical protein
MDIDQIRKLKKKKKTLRKYFGYVLELVIIIKVITFFLSFFCGKSDELGPFLLQKS